MGLILVIPNIAETTFFGKRSFLMFKILQFHEGKENEEIKSKAAYIFVVVKGIESLSQTQQIF